ncbi:NRDE protein-domain-containing protein [Thamnocephalis sphaerospora]|uniref:NRDE protein-domain-containing protein n=1 Tax=Thamnocephalis sphaerospora TaxID=78915 RepID=A0A4P9XVB0_9FUNG|nr:NRDE protein-domain-containing protein [Thamnocephalis sphaerospora]|eukprot:RKP10207.1 NRDE protein-domain-containing protein [Thamnocephalis sphaerospora]
MCILFTYHASDPSTFPWKLVLASNRDEMIDRPADPASIWPAQMTATSESDGDQEVAAPILAGRDRLARGTWLGLTLDGRLAALTNRPPAVAAHVDTISVSCAVHAGLRSRGLLLTDFLASRGIANIHQLRSADSSDDDESLGEEQPHASVAHIEPPAYLERVLDQRERYAGFNLLVGDVACDQYAVLSHVHDVSQTIITNADTGVSTINDKPSSKCQVSMSHTLVFEESDAATRLEPNTPYVISNASFPVYTPADWPKLAHGQESFARIMAEEKSRWKAAGADAPTAEALGRRLLDMLSDAMEYSDYRLADSTATNGSIVPARCIRVPLTLRPLGWYATRVNTIILVDHDGNVTFAERAWDSMLHDRQRALDGEKNGSNNSNGNGNSSSSNPNVLPASMANVFQFQLGEAQEPADVARSVWRNLNCDI